MKRLLAVLAVLIFASVATVNAEDPPTIPISIGCESSYVGGLSCWRGGTGWQWCSITCVSTSGQPLGSCYIWVNAFPKTYACCSCDPYATCVEKVNHGGGGPGGGGGDTTPDSVDPGLIKLLLAILGR